MTRSFLIKAMLSLVMSSAPIFGYAKTYAICNTDYRGADNTHQTVPQCLEELEKLGRKALKAPACSRLIDLNQDIGFHLTYERFLALEEESGPNATLKSILSVNPRCQDELDVFHLSLEMSGLDELVYYMRNP